MNEEKLIEAYMFACANNANIVIEAEDKMNAIQVFQDQYSMLFLGDWNIYRITTRINSKGEYIRY